MGCPLSPEEILEDFKSFYYETALSAYESNLLAMEKFVEHDHILFGSDFPGKSFDINAGGLPFFSHAAVSKDMADWYTANLEQFYDQAKLRAIMRDNAIKLFLGHVEH